jgi:LysM repeat protein
MAKPNPKKPDTAVLVEKGDTLKAIAKANDLTVAQLLALNPQLTSDPKYKNGSVIFANTNINIAPRTKPAAAETPAVVLDRDKQRQELQAMEDAAGLVGKDVIDAQIAADAKVIADAKVAADAKVIADAKAAADAKIIADAKTTTDAKIIAAQTNLNTSGNVTTPAQIAADVAAKVAADKIAADARLKESNRQSIIQILQDRFAKYGMSGLGAKIQELAIDGATEATITLGLQATDEYKTRFKANEERAKKGLTVLQPAEYLNLEDGYRQVLRSYGLKAFDNDAYVQQFISNDVSAAELSNRVVTAVQRVQNADPAVSKQLRDFYGIASNDLVAYVLDPQQQFQKIERQVAASEIGVAAGRQGLTVGVGVAEQLAAQGVSQAEAQKGYSTIADILPTAEKLSSIYGETTAKYGQNEAEQEVFNSLASAQRARQKLTALETATFGGQSGMARNALTAPKSGNF